MKKFIKHGLLSLAFLSILFFANSASAQTTTAVAPVVCPAGYTCTLVVCPEGYTCTELISQPTGCPANYVCRFTESGTSTTQTTDATAKVNSSNLILKYDSKNAESSLISTHGITVNGGKNGVYVYKDLGVNIGFIDQNGNQSRTNSLRTSNLIATTTLKIVVNKYGENMYSIPAGTSAYFIATSSDNTLQMFAGTYYASVYGLYVESTLNSENSIYITVPNNRTNTKTIIGEKSPYIKQPIGQTVGTSDSILKITGQRFLGKGDTKILIDGVVSELASFQSVLSIDRANIFFKKITPGYHTLQLRNSEGESNRISFEVVGPATPVSKLGISTDPTSPDAGIVVIDDTSDTNDVTLLVGKVKVEGTSDVLVDTFPITLTTTADSVGAVTGSLTLKIDGAEFSESVSLTAVQTGSVTFDNLDLNLTAGKTYSFTVIADINDTNNSGVTATDFDENDSLTASVSLNGKTIYGSTQTFITAGPLVSFVSANMTSIAGTSANDDVGLFTIKYKVTAVGGSVYLPSLAADGAIYSVDRNGVIASSTNIVASLVNNTDSTLTKTRNYEIKEGTSETFTLAVSVPLSEGLKSGQYRLSLKGIKWSNTDSVKMFNVYNSSFEAFKTEYVVLNNVRNLARSKSSSATCLQDKKFVIGDKGEEVTYVQDVLIKNGYLTMPKGAALGYYGEVTRNALLKYQSSCDATTPSIAAPKIVEFRTSHAITPTVRSTSLVWNTSGVVSCDISGPNFTSNVSYSGKESISTGNLVKDSTYTLNCKNSIGQSTSDKITIYVPPSYVTPSPSVTTTPSPVSIPTQVTAPVAPAAKAPAPASAVVYSTPHIDSISPTSGKFNDQITILGTNFEGVDGSLIFIRDSRGGEINPLLVSRSSTKLVFKVPNIPYQTYDISLLGDKGDSNIVKFTVIPNPSSSSSYYTSSIWDSVKAVFGF